MGNKVSVTLESGDEIHLSNGETLGDLHASYGEGMLRDKTDHSRVIAARSIKIPNGEYDYIRKKTVRSAYVVTAMVKGGYSCKGARGNIYKLLEQEHGCFSVAEGKLVFYTDNDLSVKAYFVSWDKACNFQTHLNDWEMHKELVNLTAVETQNPTEVQRPNDLERFLLSHYNPQDYKESPCHTLNELKSYHWSVPLTETIENDTPLAQYQSLDRHMANLNHIKCHLHDKAKNKKLQNDENNMIAASWPFHHMMDGIATTEKIPTLRLSFISASDHIFAAHDNRYGVTVGIEFRDPASAGNYQAPNGAIQEDQLNWRTVVYVKNKETFKTCLEWKHNSTTMVWNRIDQELNSDN